MSKRSQRLAKYLERDLGWIVFESAVRSICNQCKNNTYGNGKFCIHCGSKLSDTGDTRRRTLKELEDAIAYALLNV